MAEVVDAGQRGRLVLKDRAVQRIAEAAARNVPGVAPSARTSAGSDASSGSVGDVVSSVGSAVGSALSRDYPRVECVIAGQRVHARVEVVGLWPVPAPSLAGAVRAAVASQLQTVAGMHVDGVDVEIAKYVHPTTPERSRVR